ncbi:UNVERIFIED_CONTAM: AraC family transcriptional regulator [Raoultella ornithinolytica]
MYALTALREGRTITDVALSLGYEHPAAFTSMFRKTIGQAPTAFVRQMNGGPV